MLRVDVAPGEARPRLDHFLVAFGPALSRSALKRLIEERHVSVNGAPSRPSRKLDDGDEVVVIVPPPTVASAEPEDIPLDIVFEDEHLIVVNKPAGLVVHPAIGHPTGTLVNALVHHCDDLSGIGGELRPGIVHRIDKDTSGLLVATKNDDAHRHMAALFAEHSIIEREYLAIVAPPPTSAAGTFTTLYGRHPTARKKFSSKVARGKKAVTHYVCERRFPLAAVVRCRLETGRTHQIRVHFSDAGSPLLADPLYARRRHGHLGELAAALGRQALHATVLGFAHPVSGEALRFESPLPADIATVVAELESSLQR